MKKVLVTGGAGYVGSHACKAMAAAGFTPIVYDNLINGHRDFVKWGPFELGDITDKETLVAAMTKHQPIAVMHFAAFAYVGESVTEPQKYYRNNVLGTLSLLEAMREMQLDHIVFSSSCATYGEPKEIPISEETFQNPINPYGRTKLIGEQMMRDFRKAYDLKWMALRYFNAAGADEDGEIGERHHPETHLIPLAIMATQGNQLKVFGDNFPTRDGTCIRDYIHVSDLANAHVLALKYLLDDSSISQAINLGTGHGHSVMEIIRQVEETSGLPLDYLISPAREGDPPALVADASRATELLGWKPHHSSLSNIVETAWRWHQTESDGAHSRI